MIEFSKVRILILIFLVSALTGCAGPDPFSGLIRQGSAVTDLGLIPRSSEPANVKPADHPKSICFAKQERRALAAYYYYIQKFSQDELKNEYDLVLASFERNGGDNDRLRLIFLSLLPETPFSDTGYASELLTGFRGRDFGGRPDILGLIKVLDTLASEQIKTRQDLAQGRERIKTLRRSRMESRELVKNLTLKLEKEQKQNKILLRQLRELKNIEEIITDREKVGLPGE
ncbi:MAG: hypothetical protein U9O82_13045 [Thermodesulfobacteriota bacterium]|nr:hypothetical protein [Thermodesulfobacteriota bacterium]